MRKIFDVIIEIIFWIAIWASPSLVSFAIGVLIYIKNENLLWLSIIILSIGFILGIFFAERIRKKYGCTRYMAKILATPDFWPDETPEEINARKKEEELRQEKKKKDKGLSSE
ncbi:MAG: hypothetical protein ABUT20_43150 [Bacteroidota bacterium]